MSIRDLNNFLKKIEQLNKLVELINKSPGKKDELSKCKDHDEVIVLTKSIPSNTFKVADSQVATRWGNITDFKNFDLITPNEKEARFSLADQDSSISVLTRELLKKTNFKNLILKLGERGLVGVSNWGAKTPAINLPSFANNVVDNTGTGDALLSYATLSLISTKSIVIASIMGSIAAACACENDGNIAVKPDQIINKIDSLENSITYKVQK